MKCQYAEMQKISIHALREEGDSFTGSSHIFRSISIHALREEGDTSGTAAGAVSIYFYPRPPRGGRPAGIAGRCRAADFYPRPPRGGRPGVYMAAASGDIFLSTPSARRATAAQTPPGAALQISIHALREEGDEPKSCTDYTAWDFYPRPPRGGRPVFQQLCTVSAQNFYPRPPRGGRLQADRAARPPRKISIHALREEGDRTPAHWKCGGILFLSTPSARRATHKPGK